jgi:hypothetical protein
MYPRNAASPERISIGAVVQISDGAVQTAGVAVKVIPFGQSETTGAGTVAYTADGVVLYTPTQAETNYTSFVLVASKSGCIPATVTVVTSASATAGYGGVDWGKVTAATSAVALTNTTISTSQAVASVSGAVGSVTGNVGGNVVGSVGSVSGVSFPTNFDKIEITSNGHVSAAVYSIANNSITANSIQGGAITAAKFAAGAITSTVIATDAIGAAQIAADAVTEIQAGLATLANQNVIIAYIDTEITAIKSVTDKLNTGLVQDGAVYQFTANMLELSPGGTGGGSATIENQELILDEIDSLRNAFASAVGRLAVSAQLLGFPPSIVRNADYSTVTESEIRLSLKDVDGNPITEIGGVPCDEITWLFGLGSERNPALIEGAATWDDANDQLVIQLAAADTADKPTGTLTWQIGCTIDETTRYLGGGTTRLLERHF